MVSPQCVSRMTAWYTALSHARLLLSQQIPLPVIQMLPPISSHLIPPHSNPGTASPQCASRASAATSPPLPSTTPACSSRSSSRPPCQPGTSRGTTGSGGCSRWVDGTRCQWHSQVGGHCWNKRPSTMDSFQTGSLSIVLQCHWTLALSRHC